MTRIVPDDTRKKWRIVMLPNKKYAVQRKFLFWWLYESITVPSGFADFEDLILEFEKLKLAEEHIKKNCKKQKTNNVICHYNDEGIEV